MAVEVAHLVVHGARRRLEDGVEGDAVVHVDDGGVLSCCVNAASLALVDKRGVASFAFVAQPVLSAKAIETRAADLFATRNQTAVDSKICGKKECLLQLVQETLAFLICNFLAFLALQPLSR